MVGAPAATPVTTPVVLTVASPVLLLLHVPPPGVEANVVARPAHTLGVPVMVEGVATTVNTAVVEQPVPNVYVIVALPVAPAVTTPVAEPMPATEVALLVHVPPGVASVNPVELPEQSVSEPAMAAGKGLTVNG